MTDAEKIHDEVHEQVSKCTCVKQFRIHQYPSLTGSLEILKSQILCIAQQFKLKWIFGMK
jgi:hypothetical protein